MRHKYPVNNHKKEVGNLLKKESRDGHKYKTRHHLFWEVLCGCLILVLHCYDPYQPPPSPCLPCAEAAASQPHAGSDGSTALRANSTRVTPVRLHKSSVSIRTWLGGVSFPSTTIFRVFCKSGHVADCFFFCFVAFVRTEVSMLKMQHKIADHTLLAVHQGSLKKNLFF